MKKINFLLLIPWLFFCCSCEPYISSTGGDFKNYYAQLKQNHDSVNQVQQISYTQKKLIPVFLND